MRKAGLFSLLLAFVVVAIGCVPVTQVPAAPVVQTVVVPATPDPSAVTAPTGDPVSVGLIVNLTGQETLVGEDEVRAMQIAVDEINASGGIQGRPFRVIVEDSENRPEAGIEAAHKLIDVDKVPIVIGGTGSGVFLPVANYAKEQNVIALNTSSSSPLNRQLAGTVFTVIGLDDVMGKELTKWAYDKGFRNAALLNVNNSFGTELAKVEEADFAERGGKIAARVDYETAQADYRPDLQRIISANPDVILCGAYGDDSRLLFKQATELGLTVPWYCMYPTSLYIEDFKQADGRIFGLETGYTPPSADAFYTKFEQINGVKPKTAYAVYGYDAIMLAALALRGADLTNPDSIREALTKAAETYEGATGKLEFDADGQRSNVVLQQIRMDANGEWVPAE